MSIASATGQILCQIPPELRQDLLKGAIRLTGSVLRDTRTGRIVGFLQEAGPLGKLVGTGAGLLGAAAAGPGAALAAAAVMTGMQVASLAQGEATRRGISRVEGKLDVMHQDIATMAEGVDLLQALGVANLALGAAGIGVSVIGFGIVTAKLGQVQNAVQQMGDRIDSISDRIDRLRQDAIDADFSDLLSLTGLYEECWGFLENARAEQQWHHIQQAALVMQNRFADRARKLLAATIGHADAADAMLDAVALAASLRVASLVACNEAGLARSVAQESAQLVESITGTIGLVDLAKHTLGPAEPGTHDYELSFATARDTARPLLRKLREREAALATRAAPLDLLEQRGIAPRTWLEAARQEQDQPLLFLPAGR